MGATRMCSGCAKLFPSVAFIPGSQRCYSCRRLARKAWRDRPLVGMTPAKLRAQAAVRATALVEQLQAATACACCGAAPIRAPLKPAPRKLASVLMCWRCRLAFQITGYKPGALSRMDGWLAASVKGNGVC